MARRRKRRRARTRYVTRYRPSRRRRSRYSSSKVDMMTIVGSMVYGGMRSKLSDYLGQFTGSIPFGNVSDEIALGGAMYMLKRFIRNPMITKIANAGMIVESARIGESIAQGSILGQKTAPMLYV